MLMKLGGRCLVLCAVLVSSFGSAAEPGHLYDYSWHHPGSMDRILSVEAAEQRLSEADVVFFGELHEHPGAHLAQMELFAQMYVRDQQLSLSLEQFERDTQGLLDQYLKGEIGEDYLIDRGRAWKNYRSSYRPLVEFSRERGLPVIAANAPKQMVVCVGRSGLAILERYPDVHRQHVAEDIDVSDGGYRRKFFRLMQQDSAHKMPTDAESMKMMQKMSDRSFAAQAVRDDTMAESIARHINANPGRRVLHLNGNFHSSEFLGTVERLKKRLPEIKVAVIHIATEREVSDLDPTNPPGDLILMVKDLPEKFVQEAHRKAWLEEVMKKRMEGRKNCPE